MKKIIVVALSVVFLVGVFAVVAPVQAASLSEVQKQLQSLLGQVKQMQAQNQSAAVIDAVSSDETMETSAPTTTNWCFTFKNNLRRGDAGRQVSNLHIAMMNDLGGPVISNPEAAKKLFGVTTKSAVIDFQKKYNIIPAEGFVGNLTRAQLNQLYGCGGTSSSSSSSSTWSSSSSSSSATSTPSITVLSPNGGEIWKTGKNHQIKFKIGESKKGFIDLLVYPEGNEVNYVFNDFFDNRVLSTGIHTSNWTIPQSLSPGKYQAKIYLKTSPVEGLVVSTDTGDAPFSIVNSGTGSGLTQNQIDAIIALLKSFGANQSAIDSTRAVLEGK